jgi:hypothetical protein
MDLDLYDDTLGGLIPDGDSLVESDDIFVRAGKQLHDWYRKGIEDALAYYLDGAIYLVHSGMNGEDNSLMLTENRGVPNRTVDEAVVDGRIDEKADVTVKCLNAYSSRFFG